MSKEKICVALDFDDLKQIKYVIDNLKDKVGWFKINSAFTKYGPQLVEYIKQQNCKLFLDLKFHDIPNTVANYARIVTSMGVDMFNVHACGGADMMQAAVLAANEQAEKLHTVRPKVIAVTVLTSMDEHGLNEISINKSPEEQVLSLANLANSAHIDGVVASAKEAAIIRENLRQDFLIVTPGIRPTWSVSGDQKRIVTPKQAIDLGVDIMVIGRPITQAENMSLAADKILEEIENNC